jgi:hypothetical protein
MCGGDFHCLATHFLIGGNSMKRILGASILFLMILAILFNIIQINQPFITKSSDIKVDHSASYMGNGIYLFSTDITWLKMPLVRDIDSIGSCARDCKVIEGTSTGTFSYDKTTIVEGKTTTTRETGTIAPSDCQSIEDGFWTGSACTIHLPEDKVTPHTTTYIKNYTVHYEYQGYVAKPTLEMYFNSVGIYCHSIFAPGFKAPSISMSETGPFIGIASTKKDIYSNRLELHYIP